MRVFIVVLTVIILSSAALAQVDTLMLVEDYSIEAPGDINEIYVESITDTSKAIFICTDSYIYAYDSQTNELIWSSPELSNPEDLQFDDINNDGYIDLSFRDSLNIYLYDVVNTNVICMSPILNNVYCCYTVADLDDDNFKDLIIANKEPFSRYGDLNNKDTSWIASYLYPEYDIQDSITLLLTNYQSYNSDYANCFEIPIRVDIHCFESSDSANKSYFVYTNKSEGEGAGVNACVSVSGSIYIINNSEINCYEEKGYLLSSTVIPNEENNQLFTLTMSSISCGANGIDYYCRSVNLYGFDHLGLLLVRDVWNYEWLTTDHNLRGHVISDISTDESGLEFCYVYRDSIYLASFPYLNNLWSIYNTYRTSISEMFCVLQYPPIYTSIKVIFGPNSLNNYTLYDGNTGNTNAILKVQSDNILNSVYDLNADGNDEILSIDGSALHVYHLDYFVDVDQPVTVPYSTFIQANYPNPFNAATTIQYGLENDAHVTIDIYDILGRKVTTLVDETKLAGLHQATWQAGDTPSGVYFYKINAGEYTNTKKMMLLK